ncbi:MAG TPA: hypothetical protein VGR54_03445 [Nitrosopumilaceae archaeon]|nr:hypothetical protein [Nitrosopumilaceae archaeon]
MIEPKTLTEIGLIFGFVGAFLIAIPAFKSKLQHLPDFNETKVTLISTRNGLISIGIGFVLQFVALIIQP